MAENPGNQAQDTIKSILKNPSTLEDGTQPSDPVDKYYANNYYTVTGVTGNDREMYKHIPRSGAPRSPSVTSCFKSLHPTHPGEKITKREFRKSLYWLTYSNKRFSFRQFGFLMIVLAYSIGGASFFYALEHEHEKEVVRSRVVLLEDAMVELADELTGLVNDPKRRTTEEEQREYVKATYIKMMKLEGAYRWTTYFKLEDPDNNYKWTLGSALFFCMNVFTTTGYGSIAPETRIAQYVVVFYGLIFVPMTLVVLRSLGQLYLVFFTNIYARLLIKYRQCRGFPDNKANEIISLPMKFALLVFMAYWLYCSVFIHEYDRVSGPIGTGITFFGAVYFSFISLTTVGLGDVMPNNVQFKPIITTTFLFGIPLLKVVNRATFLAYENGAFAIFAVMENKLASIMTRGQKPATPEEPIISRLPSVHAPTPQADRISPSKSDEEQESRNDWANNFSIGSIATFMRSNSDVYGGGYGRVDLRRADLLPSNNQTTVQSIR